MVLLESEEKLQPGGEAPDFSLPGVKGEALSLDNFSNYDALLIVFTCNHCPYAEAKFEELNRLAEEFDELVVVGINPNDAEEYPEDSITLLEFITWRGEGYPWPPQKKNSKQRSPRSRTSTAPKSRDTSTGKERKTSAIAQ